MDADASFSTRTRSMLELGSATDMLARKEFPGMSRALDPCSIKKPVGSEVSEAARTRVNSIPLNAHLFIFGVAKLSNSLWGPKMLAATSVTALETLRRSGTVPSKVHSSIAMKGFTRSLRATVFISEELSAFEKKDRGVGTKDHKEREHLTPDTECDG